MVDAIFILLLCALVFLGIAAAAAFLFLPLVKLFRRKEMVENRKKAKEMEYVEDYAGC